MRVMDKFIAKAKDNKGAPPVTLAFIGDSVTQGCFELYNKLDGDFTTLFDKNNAYHAHLAKLLAVLYPTVPVNIINAGVSGGRAPHGLERLDRDVISHNPDLAVVCFGLNDCMRGVSMINDYTDALDEIFKKLKSADIEAIFMTPNMMCTELSCHLKEQNMIDAAIGAGKAQNEGVLDKYLDEAKKVANNNGVKICDCYSKWKNMYQNGVDITELLANKINHPTREMNYLFAVSLLETMMS